MVLDMNKLKFTDENLIEIMKDYYKKYGGVQRSDFCAKNGLPSSSVYIKRFSSWNKSKELAGIPCIKRTDYKISPESLIEKFKEIVKDLGCVPSLNELDTIKEFPSLPLIYKHFGDYHNFIELSGFVNNRDGKKYKKDFLIDEIKRFVNEFNRVPNMKDFENLEGYPARKTFTNHFGNYNDAIRLAGFEPVGKNLKEFDEKYRNKDYLTRIIQDYISKYDKTPTLREINKEVDFNLKNLYRDVFGSWNKALTYLGLKLNSVSRYEDSFLESEFHRFFKENGRIPIYAEFNNSEYPSFWCYQSRFGSWNKAVVAYGYIPNDAHRKYELDDGEICASSYEFDISTWLKSKNIKYIRDVNYIDFIDGYKGKMNCDYLITYNDAKWYVEMAGFLRGTDFSKFSEAERNYYFKLKYKRTLLRRQGVNYVIIEPCDLKNKSYDELFHFIN